MDQRVALRYFFSKDLKQLRQYYRLRKLIYAADLGLDIDPVADMYDPMSEILTVYNRHRCVGGVRLTICNKGEDHLLPMESDDFKLRELLPDLELEHANYAEISKLILLPEYRDGEITQRIYKDINRKCRQLGVQYLFAITPYIQARRYLLSSKLLGFNIKMADIKIPYEQKDKYGGLAECLLILSQEPSQLAIITAKSHNKLASVTSINSINS